MAKQAAKQKKNRIMRTGINFSLAFVAILLICIGIIMVLSSTYVGLILKDKGALSDFIEHVAVAVIGLVAMFVFANCDYRLFNNRFIVTVAMAVSILLLIAVFFFRDRGGAHRWIEIGSFTFQPSEIAKFVLVLFLAYYLSHNRNWYKSINTWFIPFIPILIFAGLIVMEPNLSTTLICILLPSLLLLFISGMQSWLFVLGGIGAAGAGAVLVFFTDWRAGRVGAWLNPFADVRGDSYQIVQSLYALGNGNLWGVGLGNSKQKITHLPMADTDYIFAIIGEEFGFIGAVIVLLLYAAFIFLGLRVAMNAPDLFGTYLASGITIIFAMQVLINIGVVTNTIPSTGVTLPFISRGSTSLLAFTCATGLLLSVSAYSKRRAKPEKQAVEPKQKPNAEILEIKRADHRRR